MNLTDVQIFLFVLEFKGSFDSCPSAQAPVPSSYNLQAERG